MLREKYVSTSIRDQRPLFLYTNSAAMYGFIQNQAFSKPSRPHYP